MTSSRVETICMFDSHWWCLTFVSNVGSGGNMHRNQPNWHHKRVTHVSLTVIICYGSLTGSKSHDDLFITHPYAMPSSTQETPKSLIRHTTPQHLHHLPIAPPAYASTCWIPRFKSRSTAKWGKKLSGVADWDAFEGKSSWCMPSLLPRLTCLDFFPQLLNNI